ncbi:Protein of unknown function [Allochromatium warmingii]|uniref:DUF2442 domain-containing protein n=1 Tax=Allochromatium warmingii TaxID=61595 RepID=A0A1H3JBD2_ALLWA|nr:DUF2442 domain-containing protein [Allochromatium warmingii]SDY37320.1 Protein of unknown function [Allochromatium warmingii]
MIKIIEANFIENGCLELAFSNGAKGVFDVWLYCSNRQGPLLEPLQSENYIKRYFIDMGALGWPNGLELSPERLYELCEIKQAA